MGSMFTVHRVGNDGEWGLSVRYNVVSVHATKEAAIEVGRKNATEQGGKVVWWDADGFIREENYATL